MTDPLADLGADHYSYRDDELHCEDVPVAELAERFGTPLYVYSRASFESRFRQLRRAFGPDARICFAVKANSNLAILRLFAGLGAGFDLVSGGELRRLQQAGVPCGGAVFAGVGKEEWEVREAQRAGILFFNLESAFELDLFETIAAGAPEPLPIALRINPDVEADTHEYIRTGTRGDKFGLDLATAASVAERIAASPRLRLVGCHVHLGSQLHEPTPYTEALDVVERFLDEHAGLVGDMRYYDLGGGIGVSYGVPGAQMDVDALAAELTPRLAARGLTPVLEPGRFLVADAGCLLTRVLGIKGTGPRRFAVVDGGMNDLMRPALYHAEHPIRTVRRRSESAVRYDVVGPVCESGDFLALDRELPELAGGDLMAVFAAGAYGSTMASNYNSRRRPAEVLVSGAEYELIRRRESFEELWAAEETQA